MCHVSHRAAELGLVVPSKAKKADVAKLIFGFECKGSGTAAAATPHALELVGASSTAAVLLALECVWAASAQHGSPSTVRSAAAMMAPLLSSSSSPSAAAFALLSATGVRARHIVDELMKGDAAAQAHKGDAAGAAAHKSREAWWHKPAAAAIFDAFRRGCADVRLSQGWEAAVEGCVGGAHVCCISTHAASVTVTRSCAGGQTVSYTQVFVYVCMFVCVSVYLCVRLCVYA